MQGWITVFTQLLPRVIQCCCLNSVKVCFTPCSNTLWCEYKINNSVNLQSVLYYQKKLFALSIFCTIVWTYHHLLNSARLRSLSNFYFVSSGVVENAVTYGTFQPRLQKMKKKHPEKSFYIFFEKSHPKQISYTFLNFIFVIYAVA